MVKKVDGVDPRKVSAETLKKSLEGLGLDPQGSTATKISTLAAHIRDVYGSPPDDSDADAGQEYRKRMGKCDKCGGSSPMPKGLKSKAAREVFAVCPFCGDQDVDVDPPETQAKKPKRKPVEEVVHDAELVAAKDFVVPENLDGCVVAILTLKSSMAVSYHQIGSVLKHVLDNETWASRKLPDGEQEHDSFLSWARAECGLERIQIRQIMDVAANFSETEVKDFGPSKLNMILTVPKEHRGRLMQAIRDGAPRQKLREMAREIPDPSPRIGEGSAGSTPEGANRTSAATLAAAEARREARAAVAQRERITVAMAPGVVAVPLKCGKDGTREATCMADLPFGTEDLENSVKVDYRLTSDENGNWVLFVERHRINVAGK